MKRLGSVQAAHIGLEAIEDDLVVLSGGQYRAVLEVGALNFGLEREEEQEAIVASFTAFLNGLSFPIQVLIQAVPIDLDAYLSQVEQRGLLLPAELAELARDHVLYLRRLARRRTLLERRFYVVVPAGNDGSRSSGWRFGRRIPLRTAAESARKQLTFRCEEIGRELARCGMPVRRLNSAELAQLFYACWCPQLARVQRLQQNLADYTALVVQAGAQEERIS